MREPRSASSCSLAPQVPTCSEGCRCSNANRCQRRGPGSRRAKLSYTGKMFLSTTLKMLTRRKVFRVQRCKPDLHRDVQDAQDEQNPGGFTRPGPQGQVMLRECSRAQVHATTRAGPVQWSGVERARGVCCPRTPLRLWLSENPNKSGRGGIRASTFATRLIYI